MGVTQEICSVVEDFSLVSFTTLSVREEESIARLQELVDKASGYVYERENSLGPAAAGL